MIILRKPRNLFVFGTILLFSGWISACGSDATNPSTAARPKKTEPARTVVAKNQPVTEWYDAVGTVRPRTETRIEAQVTAQVKEVSVGPGSKVNAGDTLMTLDDRQFASRLDQAREALKTAVAGEKQARQGVAAAEAAFEQARSEYERTRGYFKEQAATTRDLENAKSQYLQAEAGLRQAREALTGATAGIRQAGEVVKEAEIALGYTRITAPAAGEVIERLAQPGDMALPGKPLLTMRTSGFLRLEAYVREGLISKISVGMTLPVDLTTLKVATTAVVEEIVPYADPQTRTFLVKAAFLPVPGLYPGMYGKLKIPVQDIDIITLPEAAVRRVGQLELVDVKTADGFVPQYVKTGLLHDSGIEIVSGLNPGDVVALP